MSFMAETKDRDAHAPLPTAQLRPAARRELGLARLTNAGGMEISVLPNGCVFAIEHVQGGERTMISQVFGSPLGSGIGRLCSSRRGAPAGRDRGAWRRAEVGAGADRFVWAGETEGLRHSVTLWLHPQRCVWLWHLDLENNAATAVECDAILIQDLGLAARGMVLANEAYTSQYIDHVVVDVHRQNPGHPPENGGRPRQNPGHPPRGFVVMSRQNMAQYGRHPWVAHGCLEGAVSFATDASQLFGPACRETAGCVMVAARACRGSGCRARRAAPRCSPRRCPWRRARS